ncbi:MAG: transglycosylase SLT domain-containing protein [Nitrosomonas sp.]|nr:transglycosylase SLT domain-containing protein [Nitrosomonas sp.]
MHLKKLIQRLLIIFLVIPGSALVAGNIQTEINALQNQNPIDEAKAIYALAKQHEHAEGLPRDYSKAAELYCEAINLGHDEAIFALGWMYANGRGVPRNDGIAAQLFNMAVERGHKHATKMLRYLDSTIEPIFPECIQTYTGINIFEYSEKPYFDLVQKLAPQYHLDPALVMAIITVESAFNPQAISHKNAQGLMQLIPETAERFQVKNAFDPEENIKGGMAYLRWLLAFFKGDVVLTVAAYNAGEGAVEKYQGIPPFSETKNYVEKIQVKYPKTTHPYQPGIVHRHAIIAFSEYD